LERAAAGVVEVANAAMERAIRRISVERGHDPADFTLVAFGGAGPLHACDLAARLGIPQVLVPRAPGVLSALGMLVADLVKDYSVTVLRPAAGLEGEALRRLFAPWEAKAREEMEMEGAGAEVRLDRSADLRYVGQSFEINVPVPAGLPDLAALRAEFHARHERRYGHAHPEAPVEFVNLRLRAVSPTAPLRFEPLPSADAPDPAEARLAVRPAWFETDNGLEPLPAPIYDREALRAGHRLAGPAVVVQMDATTVILPRWAGEVGETGHLMLRRSDE